MNKMWEWTNTGDSVPVNAKAMLPSTSAVTIELAHGVSMITFVNTVSAARPSCPAACPAACHCPAVPHCRLLGRHSLPTACDAAAPSPFCPPGAHQRDQVRQPLLPHPQLHGLGGL